MTTIKAQEGYIFRRKHDRMIFGKEIVLGYDFSTGKRRVDSEDFYEEIEEVLTEEEILVREIEEKQKELSDLKRTKEEEIKPIIK